MTQHAEFNQIEAQWIADGSPWCEHTRVDSEFYFGSRSGDRGCLDCGNQWAKGTSPEPRGNK